MPTSHSQGKDVALNWYRQIAPKTVVDVGAGSGTYARLMRPADNGQAMWVAVEVWHPYIDQFDLFASYDFVFLRDARELRASEFKADLVIFGDVLEHMTCGEARSVLAAARVHAANIIVSIPVLHLDQDDVNGNPYERHVDHWSYEQMREELDAGLVKSWWGDVLAYYWWRRPA
jgi:hypothetical protein